MFRMTTLLLGAGALAACSQGENATVPNSEQASSAAITAVDQPVPVAPEKTMPSDDAVPAASQAPESPVPSAAAKAPRPEPAAPKPSPKSDPSPPPAKVECEPEHREMGHC